MKYKTTANNKKIHPMRKHRFILLIFLFFLMNHTYSQSFNSMQKNENYARLLIGVNAGASILLTTDYEDLFSSIKYSIGGSLKIRPIKSYGFETGFKFHNILNYGKFYDIPLLLHIYTKNNKAIFIGPNLLYKYNKSATDFSTPMLSGTIGFGNQYGGLYLTVLPNLFEDLKELQELNIYLGLSIHLSLGFGRVSYKKSNSNTYMTSIIPN